MKKNLFRLLTGLVALLVCAPCTGCAKTGAPALTDAPRETATSASAAASAPAETEPEETPDPRPRIVRQQLEKAILVPDVSVSTGSAYSIYNRDDKNQRATFVLPAGAEYVKTGFSPFQTNVNPKYANLVIPKGALTLDVTVDGFVQEGSAWRGGGAAVAAAGEYRPLYDSGWLDFASMQPGKTYGEGGRVRCLEASENHIRYELDVSAFRRYDLLWNCTFDTKGKPVDPAAVRIGLSVTFGEAEPETPSLLTTLGSVGTGAYSVQGCAAWDGLLFQFYDKMGQIRVYDLDARKLLFQTDLAPSPTLHCNNASFGTEKVDPSDPFPLLYVSAENIAEHNVTAYRVGRSGDEFTFTPVQKITFPSVSEGGFYYPNAAVDAEAGILYYQGWPKESWKKNEYQSTDTLKLIAYELPELSEGDVTLRRRKPVGLPLKTATQGWQVIGGTLYQVYGTDAGNNFLSVIDCKTGTERFCRTLAELGGALTEPEGIAPYRDGFVITFQDGSICYIEASSLENASTSS